MPSYVYRCIRRCYIDKKLYNVDDIAVSDQEKLAHFERLGETKEKIKEKIKSKPQKPKKDK